MGIRDGQCTFSRYKCQSVIMSCLSGEAHTAADTSLPPTHTHTHLKQGQMCLTLGNVYRNFLACVLQLFVLLTASVFCIPPLVFFNVVCKNILSVIKGFSDGSFISERAQSNAVQSLWLSLLRLVRRPPMSSVKYSLSQPFLLEYSHKADCMNSCNQITSFTSSFYFIWKKLINNWHLYTFVN